MVEEVMDMSTIKEGNVLVDFYTPTCAPCKVMHPVLEELSEEFDDVKIAKVDVTKTPAASQVYGVMSVPTLMFMKDSQVKEIAKGFCSADNIKGLIRKHFKAHPKMSVA